MIKKIKVSEHRIENFMHPYTKEVVSLEKADDYWGRVDDLKHDGYIYFEIDPVKNPDFYSQAELTQYENDNNFRLYAKVAMDSTVLHKKYFGITQGEGQEEQINIFLKYIYENNVGAADWSGSYTIDETLYLGEYVSESNATWRSSGCATKVIYGAVLLRLKNGCKRGLIITRFERGTWIGLIEVRAVNIALSAKTRISRGMYTGVIVTGIGKSNFTGFYGWGLAEWALVVTGVYGGCHGANIGNVGARDCGSGQFMGPTSNSFETNWTYKGTNGISNTSKNHRFLIQVDELPPEDFVMPVVVIRLGKEPYYIDWDDSNTDRATNTLAIYPRRGSDITDVALDAVGGTARFFYGGGVAVYGWEANHVYIEKTSVFRSGIAVWCAAQSNPTINSILMDSGGVPILTGRTNSNPGHSYYVGHLYYESCTYDLIHLNAATNQYGSNVITGETNMNLSKIKTITYNTGSEIPSTILPYKGRWYTKDARVYHPPIVKNEPNSINITLTDKIIANYDDLYYNSSIGCPIQLKYNRDIGRLFNKNTINFILFGSGENGQPTGAVDFITPDITVGTTPKYREEEDTDYLTYPDGTVNDSGVDISGNAVPVLPSEDTENIMFDIKSTATINGGADLTLSDFNAPLNLTIVYDVAANNFIVKIVSGKKEPNEIVYTPTGNFNTAQIITKWNTDNPNKRIFDLHNKTVLIKDDGNNYTLTLDSTLTTISTLFKTENTGVITVAGTGVVSEGDNFFGGKGGSNCLWEKIGNLNQITIRNRQ